MAKVEAEAKVTQELADAKAAAAIAEAEAEAKALQELADAQAAAVASKVEAEAEIKAIDEAN